MGCSNSKWCDRSVIPDAVQPLRQTDRDIFSGGESGDEKSEGPQAIGESIAPKWRTLCACAAGRGSGGHPEH